MDGYFSISKISARNLPAKNAESIDEYILKIAGFRDKSVTDAALSTSIVMQIVLPKILHIIKIH